MDTNEMKEYLRLISEFNTKTRECEKIYRNLTERKFESNAEWRGVKIEHWHDICCHYNEDLLLNADGDIFFVEKKDFDTYNSRAYIGRRVLWNMQLSTERYMVFETPIYDVDGEFECNEYTVELYKG